MAFTLIEKSIHRLSGRVAVTDVRMMKTARNGCVQVSIALPIVAPLGWERGNTVQVEAGTGDDDGWLRVTRSSSGYKVGCYRDNDKRLKFACAGILRHLKNFPTVSCRHVVANNALLVEIPARLRGATLSVSA